MVTQPCEACNKLSVTYLQSLLTQLLLDSVVSICVAGNASSL